MVLDEETTGQLNAARMMLHLGFNEKKVEDVYTKAGVSSKQINGILNEIRENPQIGNSKPLIENKKATLNEILMYEHLILQDRMADTPFDAFISLCTMYGMNDKELDFVTKMTLALMRSVNSLNRLKDISE